MVRELVRLGAEDGEREAGLTQDPTRVPQTLLHKAAATGDVGIVEALGTSQRNVLWNGRTPLDVAATHGHLPVVRRFLEDTDVDAELVAHEAGSAFLSALRNARVLCAEYLLRFFDLRRVPLWIRAWGDGVQMVPDTVGLSVMVAFALQLVTTRESMQDVISRALQASFSRSLDMLRFMLAAFRNEIIDVVDGRLLNQFISESCRGPPLGWPPPDRFVKLEVLLQVVSPQIAGAIPLRQFLHEEDNWKNFRVLHLAGAVFQPCTSRQWAAALPNCKEVITAARAAACRPWTRQNLHDEWMPRRTRDRAHVAMLCLRRWGLPLLVRTHILGFCRDMTTAAAMDSWVGGHDGFVVLPDPDPATSTFAFLEDV